jgi:hypothetical protein
MTDIPLPANDVRLGRTFQTERLVVSPSQDAARAGARVLAVAQHELTIDEHVPDYFLLTKGKSITFSCGLTSAVSSLEAL